MISQNSILVDTNILLYLLDEEKPQFEKSLEFVENNKSNLVLAHQTINEYIHISTSSKIKHPLSLEQAIHNINIYTNAFAGTLCPNTATLKNYLVLLQQFAIPSNKVFDTYLVATAFTNGINKIVTFNTKDFLAFRNVGLTVIEPK